MAEKRELQVQEASGSTGLMATHERRFEDARVGMAQIEQHGNWPLLSMIPMLLTAGVPLPRFRVRDLVALKAGQTVESASAVSDDVPLKVGAVQLGWVEFEVVEQRMAVRLTRLA